MLASRAAQGLCGGLAAFAIGSATVHGLETFEYSRAGEMFMALILMLLALFTSRSNTSSWSPTRPTLRLFSVSAAAPTSLHDFTVKNIDGEQVGPVVLVDRLSCNLAVKTMIIVA